MPEYSIVICNYNMAKTIVFSLRSVLEQVDRSYEVIVVDGGSDDGSQEKLNSLSSNYDEIRTILRPSDSDTTFGEDKNTAIESARGDYIIDGIDTDDVYYQGIPEFVDIYHLLDRNIEGDFLLQGDGIKVAPDSTFAQFPFRDFTRRDDVDQWERLFAEKSIIWLKHKRFWESVGYPHTLIDKVRNNYERKVSAFRTGKSLWSGFEYSCEDLSSFDPRVYYHGVTYPLAYIEAIWKGRYEAPEGFSEIGEIESIKQCHTKELSDLAFEHNIANYKQNLSDRQRELFL